MSFSFLHTADWQIGRAFAKLPDDAAVRLRQQRIDTIKKIANIAQQREVHAVLVAGDVFDFSNVADKTIRLVINAMSGFKGHWLLIPGNHDPGTTDGVWSQMRRLGIPENVQILDQPQPCWLVEDSVVVLPAPLLKKHEATDLTEWFDRFETAPHVIRIGLAHGSIDNRLPDRGDAPNTISDSRAQKADLDYLALGDWHGTMEIANRTWYSGTHEPDRYRDNDSGNILHVNIEKHGASPTVEIVPVAHFRWKQLAPALHGDESYSDLEKALDQLGEPFDNLVLQLAPRGTASLDTRQKILDILAKWDALVHHLEFIEDGLLTEASNDELDELGSTGFISHAVAQLKDINANSDHPDHQYAQLALQLLYAEHKLLESKK